MAIHYDETWENRWGLNGKGSVRNVWVYGSSMVTAKDYVGANKNKRTRTVLGAIQRNGEPSRPEARRNAVQKPWRNR